MTNSEKVSALALDCGFFRAGVVPVGSIVFDRAFRKALRTKHLRQLREMLDLPA